MDTPNNKPDLAIIDVTTPSTSLTPSFDGNINDVPGFNAIDVITSDFDGHTYALLANYDITNQLMVVDVTNSPTLIPGASQTLPKLTNGRPKSIYYYDKKLYIGTEYVPCVGCTDPEKNNELHIYDVQDPRNPQWKASIDVGRDVNDIIVRNGLAYLATGPGSSGVRNPLKIYDIDPNSPTYKQLVGSYSMTTGPLAGQAGTSLYLIGQKLYLGLERAASSVD